MRGRAALAIAVVAALAATAAARQKRSTKKKGKVVRVERSRGSGRDVVRVCTNAEPSGSATCFGRPPRVDEIGIALDDTGVRAKVRAQTVAPILDSCQNESSWTLASRVEEGDLSALTYYTGTVVFGYSLSPSAKIIQNNGQIKAPSGRVDETIMTLVDDDGDTQPELIVAWYYCDLTANVKPYNAGAQAYCMVYYQRDGARYDELRVDVVKNCY